jgi:hypothetical protein
MGDSAGVPLQQTRVDVEDLPGEVRRTSPGRATMSRLPLVKSSVARVREKGYRAIVK